MTTVRTTLRMGSGGRRVVSGRMRSATAGFGLVEVMMVVLIVSFLALAALPAFLRVQRKSRSTAVINDLRAFASAFDAYAQEVGQFPPETKAGVLPPAMSDRLKSTDWTRKTPIGGKYNWEFNQRHGGVRYRAALAIGTATGATFVPDTQQLLEIDRIVDDGDLATGTFISGAGSVPVFVISRR